MPTNTLPDPTAAVTAVSSMRGVAAHKTRHELLSQIAKFASVRPARGTLHDVVLKGLPGHALKLTTALTGYSGAALSEYLDVTPKTLAGYAGLPHLPKVVSDRVARLLSVYVQAAETLEDPDYAAQWLEEPNERLGGRTPQELIETETGARQVLDTLLAIEHGLPT